jgi:hypothetical protein
METALGQELGSPGVLAERCDTGDRQPVVCTLPAVVSGAR